jgi:hypothetical protein
MTDDRWMIRTVRRVRIGTATVPAGTVLGVAVTHLRVAAFHVRVGAAVPFDERTRHAVEMFEACRALGEVTT